MALGRDESHAHRHGPVRPQPRHRGSVDRDLARPVDAAEQRRGHLVPPGAGDAGDADDLAGVHDHVHVVQHVAAQAADLQDDIAPLGGLGVVRDLLELAPDDQLDELVFVQSRHRPGDDVLAVPQHRDAVREPEYLVEVVRHEHDGHAGVRDPPGQLEQPLGLRRGQVGRRLVQDEHLGRVLPGRQRAGHRERRALAHGQAAGRAADIEFVAEFRQRRPCPFALLAPADPAAETGIPDAQGDVVHRVEVVDQAEILVDEPQPERLARLAAAEQQRLTAHLGRSLVGQVEPGQNLDQG